jgi:hypothetical protein
MSLPRILMLAFLTPVLSPSTGRCFAEPPSLAAGARLAVSGGAEAPAAVTALRASGPAGLQALLDLAAADPAVAAGPAFPAALDAVCGQFDCAASHLYWFTDLAAAREEARRRARPILSLRLLGRLDEELSCANSRFFRSILYPDPAVSALLRDRFVLHWESVRPVPKVSVDFGDGRRLVGTITGNSIHYVLDSRGRLVDALPGLYGPGAYRRFLDDAAKEAGLLGGLGDADFVAAIASYHLERLAAIQQRLTADLRQLGVIDPDKVAGATLRTARWAGGKPVALEASARTMSKSAAEARVLWSVSLDGPHVEMPWGQPSEVAGLHGDDARLSPESRRLLLAKAGTWMKVDDEEKAVARFERLIAEDTVRNEFLVHSVLHAWLAASRGVPDLAALNEKVYAELFLTPRSDPWLGLAPQELYAVLTPAR